MREREAIRFCTCGCCDDDSETAFFRLAPDDEDTGVAMGDEPVDSRRVEPDLMECYAFMETQNDMGNYVYISTIFLLHASLFYHGRITYLDM